MKWNSREYWLKSKTYQGRSVDMARDEAERAFWRSLALELLLRSALTSVHPALNADPQNEGLHLMYAFGIEVKDPRSIPIHAVTARLERIVHGFQKPHREFCDFMMLKRNEEMHTCELPFVAMAENTWLPHYYEVCSVLNGFIGHTLGDYFGTDEAETGHKLIAARQTKKRGEIERRIVEHRGMFERKPADERAGLAAQAVAATAWRHPGTPVHCPACQSSALLDGSLENTSEPKFEDGALVVDQRYLANVLTCGACGLMLRDIEELLVGNVQPHYTITVHTDLHEYYSPDEVDSYMNM